MNRSSPPVKASISFDMDAEIPTGMQQRDNSLKSEKVCYILFPCFSAEDVNRDLFSLDTQ